MSAPLTKSYVNTCDPDKPVCTNLVMNDLFEQTKEAARKTLMVNMDTGERVINLSLLDKVAS